MQNSTPLVQLCVGVAGSLRVRASNGSTERHVGTQRQRFSTFSWL